MECADGIAHPELDVVESQLGRLSLSLVLVLLVVLLPGRNCGDCSGLLVLPGRTASPGVKRPLVCTIRPFCPVVPGRALYLSWHAPQRQTVQPGRWRSSSVVRVGRFVLLGRLAASYNLSADHVARFGANDNCAKSSKLRYF